MELFQIMPGRYAALQDTVAGYLHTGMPLVSYTQLHGIGPILNADGDDWGAYYVIPKIMKTFGLSLDASIQLLYTGSVALAFVIGAIACWLYCKTRVGKIVSILALALLALIVAGIGDIYVFLGVTTMALVPWWLYVQERCGIKGHVIYCIVAGLFIGFAHLIRSHSGTAVIVFILLSMILKKQLPKKYVLAFGGVLLAGFFLVQTGFNNLVVKKSTDYLSNLGYPKTHIFHHLFWHNVYYALGYLSNPYGIEPSDTYALKKALSINPKVPLYGKEYEYILKKETFKVIKTHPFFVVNTLAAKFGVCLMYFLIFSNIGALLAMYYRKGYAFDLPFAAGIVFNMIFGIIITPDYQFLLGLFAFSTLFAIYSIDFAITQRTLVARVTN